MQKFLLGLGLVIGVTVAMPAWAATGSLYSRFEGKTVKTYLADVTDESSGHEVDPALLKASLRQALESRKSTRFVLVNSPEEADIRIDTAIQGYFWTDHDPVDMLMGTAAIAMDTAVIEDYASVEARVAVTDLKSSKILWDNKFSASVTKKPMSQADSIPLVCGDFAKTFIKKCFGKTRA